MHKIIKRMKKNILTVLVLFLVSTVQAQDFVTSYDMFNAAKVSYFNLADGTKVEAKIDRVKRGKGGLIEEITVFKGNDKKNKTVLKAADIATMYLNPSGLDKMSKGLDKAYNINQWDKSTNVDDKLIKEGYAYFESSDVVVKKETKKALLQLLNPHFCTKIKVYQDPFAAETTGLAVGGLQVTGGDDKSYYIKVGTETATRVAKKNYRENFLTLFKDCKEFTSKWDSPKWADITKHIFTYSETCK